jgi:two-component system cell cycle response regulator
MAARSDSDLPRAHVWARLGFAVLALCLALHVAHALIGFGGPVADRLIGDVDYSLILVASAGLCIGRVIRCRPERRAWALLGAGLLLWAAGDVSSTFVLGEPPSPSLSDAGWLLFYPAAYAGLGLLLRQRVAGFQKSLWLDGVVGGLAVLSLGTAIVLPKLIGSVHGASVAEIATNVAYPVLDLTLIGMVIVAFGLNGWRPDRVWTLLGAGLVMSAIGDSVYVYQVAAGSYQAGGIVDSFWPASTLLIALAAWQPQPPAPRVRTEGRRLIAIPTVFGLVAIGVETYDHFARVDNASLLFASAALLVMILRLRLTLREHRGMLAESRRDALTDALTGLGNRRRLLADLEAALRLREDRVLVLYDLNGFKSYNDRFGHPAGDALLERLGRNLAGVLGSDGTAYRLGGDEFCALIDGAVAGTSALVERSAEALTERARALMVGNSYGAVRIPDESATPAGALQLADQRLYRRKSERRVAVDELPFTLPEPLRRG